MEEKIKILLDMEDTTIYDNKLAILIPGAKEKLIAEGVTEQTEDSPFFNLYLNCIAYQVAIDIDIDVDIEKLYTRYARSVVTLRGAIND